MSKFVDLKGKIINETQDALLFRTDDYDSDVWIPLSQVERITRWGHEDEVRMTDWIAKQKGLI